MAVEELLSRLSGGKKEERYFLDRPVALIGEGNSGKSTIAALLAKEFGISCWDMDELGKLSKLYHKAKRGVGVGIVVFPREKESFLYLKENPLDCVLVTLPHRHNLELARELRETAELAGARVLGCVVNLCTGEKEALQAAKFIGAELIERLPYVKKLDERAIAGDIESFRCDKKLRQKLENILRVMAGSATV